MFEMKKRTVLRVAVSEWLPWTFVDKSKGNINVTGGFLKDLARILSEYCRFDYVLTSPDDGQWGTPLPDGNFTGMIGMIQRNETDIAMGPFTANYPRSQVASFGKLFKMMYLTILAGDVKEKKPHIFSYILTFDWEIWVAMFVVLIVTTFASSFADVHFLSSRQNLQLFKSKLSKYFWAYIGTVFYQAMPMTAKTFPSRIVIAGWWMAIIVLMHTFGSHMKAKMMIEPEPDKINSIKDLIKRPHIRPIVMKGSAYETYFKTSPSEDFQKAWDMVLEHNGLLLISEMFTKETLEEVKTGKSVLISDAVTLKYNVGARCRDLGASFYFSKEVFYHHLFSVSFRKDLRRDILNDINKTIRRLFEGGNVYRMFARTDHDFGKCVHEASHNKEKVLKMEDLTGIFLLYFIGLVGATVVLGFENAYHSIQKRNLRRIASLKKWKC